MSTLTVALIAVAVLMAVATAYLIWAAVEARSRARTWVALFLLAMMGEMWVSAVVYLYAPSTSSLIAALAVSGALMAASLVPLVIALERGRRRGAGATSIGLGPISLGLGAGIGLAALVVANEFLMSWGLLLATRVGDRSRRVLGSRQLPMVPVYHGRGDAPLGRLAS